MDLNYSSDLRPRHYGVLWRWWRLIGELRAAKFAVLFQGGWRPSQRCSRSGQEFAPECDGACSLRSLPMRRATMYQRSDELSLQFNSAECFRR